MQRLERVTLPLVAGGEQHMSSQGYLDQTLPQQSDTIAKTILRKQLCYVLEPAYC